MTSIGRRDLLTGICLGFGLGVPALAIAQTDKASMRPQEGDLLVKVGDAGLVPLTPESILLEGAQTMAWAMEPTEKVVRSGSRLNMIVLVRLKPETLGGDTAKRAANGVVAYTAICTHNGCEVDQWVDAEKVLYCQCHASRFDPKDGGAVVDGPAPRELPALPLKIAEGNLVVAGSFTSRVGFE
jgi:rieske iron-sulfur protein